MTMPEMSVQPSKSLPGFTAEASLYQRGEGHTLGVHGVDDSAEATITPAMLNGCWKVVKWVDTDWGSFPVCIRHCVLPTDKMGHFAHYRTLC